MQKQDFDVLIVGGGPAGSTTGALLARAGFAVGLLEREKFPRYHIGESLVPEVLDVLDESGALSSVEQAGFLRKEGGVFRWGSDPKPWVFHFDEARDRYKYTYAYQVVRSQFDQILLDHAANCGVKVFRQTMAREFFEVPATGSDWVGARVTAVGADRQPLGFTARMVVDCSGQAGWLATKFKLRKYDPFLRNVALFAYFKGAKRMEGRETNAIFCEAIDVGWFWNIPLHDGTNSVGLITKAELCPGAGDRFGFYKDALRRSAYTGQALANAEQVADLRTITDYSYRPRCLTGPGFMLAGDAGNFIDPVWSTGIMLATTAARLASRALQSALKDNNPQALLEYETKFDEFVGRYRQFIYYFYRTNAAPDTYFWEAYSMLPNAVDPRDAFIRLVSGRLGV